MDLKELVKDYFKDLEGYYFELGVVEEKMERKAKPNATNVEEKTEQEDDLGVTNAELMFIHENGSPLRNIPQRPVLAMTIEWAKKDLIEQEYYKAVGEYIDGGFDLEKFEASLKKTAIRIERYAREIIYSNDGRLIPNSPKTLKRKKSDAPLLDTGQLAKSITCRLCKDGVPV